MSTNTTDLSVSMLRGRLAEEHIRYVTVDGNALRNVLDALERRAEALEDIRLGPHLNYRHTQACPHCRAVDALADEDVK